MKNPIYRLEHDRYMHGGGWVAPVILQQMSSMPRNRYYVNYESPAKCSHRNRKPDYDDSRGDYRQDYAALCRPVSIILQTISMAGYSSAAILPHPSIG